MLGLRIQVHLHFTNVVTPRRKRTSRVGSSASLGLSKARGYRTKFETSPCGCLSPLWLCHSAGNDVESPGIPLLAARPFSAGLLQAASWPPEESARCPPADALCAPNKRCHAPVDQI